MHPAVLSYSSASAGRVMETVAPGLVPTTLPSYIISALAGGWMKSPGIWARVRK